MYVCKGAAAAGMIECVELQQHGFNQPSFGLFSAGPVVFTAVLCVV